MDGRPRPAATAFDFPALHGEDHVVAAGIARHDLEFRSEYRVENTRKLHRVVARAGAADDHFLCQQVLDLADLRCVPRDADAYFVVGAADPAEVRAFELSTGEPEQWVERNATADGADCGAVAGRSLGKPVGEPQAARAFHILGYDRRISRNVLAQVPRQQARIEVVTAADAVAYVKLDRFALVKFSGALCMRQCSPNAPANGCQQYGARKSSHLHQSSSLRFCHHLRLIFSKSLAL